MATWESKGSILPPLSHLPGGNCWAPEGILSEEGHHMRRRAEGSQQASPSWVLAAFGTRVSQSSAMLTLAEGAICRIKALGSGSTPSGWSCCRGETCPRGSQLLLCPTLRLVPQHTSCYETRAATLLCPPQSQALLHRYQGNLPGLCPALAGSGVKAQIHHCWD